MLTQTAHKDIVKGIYSDTNEYLPVMSEIALEPYDIHAWVDKADRRANGFGMMLTSG